MTVHSLQTTYTDGLEQAVCPFCEFLNEGKWVFGKEEKPEHFELQEKAICEHFLGFEEKGFSAEIRIRFKNE